MRRVSNIGWRKHRFALCGTAACLLAAVSIIRSSLESDEPQQPGPTPSVTDRLLEYQQRGQAWSTMDLDALISRLPPIGGEAHWDEDISTWIPHPAVAEFRNRIETGRRISDSQWARALVRVGAIRVRSEWPNDVPLAVSMRRPTWLPLCEIQMVSTDRPSIGVASAGSRWRERCGVAVVARHQRDLYQELSTLPIGHNEVGFGVTIERGEDPNREPGGPPAMTVWNGTIVFPVDVVLTIDEVLPPVRDMRLDEAVASSLWIQRFGFIRDGNRGVGEGLVFWGHRSAFDSLQGVAVGIEAELWHDENLVETQRFVAKVDGHADPANSEKGWLRGGTHFERMPLDLRGNHEERQDWHFKVRSTTEGLLSSWEASKRWDGEFSISVDTLFRRER